MVGRKLVTQRIMLLQPRVVASISLLARRLPILPKGARILHSRYLLTSALSSRRRVLLANTRCTIGAPRVQRIASIAMLQSSLRQSANG